MEESLTARLTRWMELVREAGVDGWLLADFRRQNPLFARMLGLQGGILSRRSFLWLPATGTGEATVLASQVDGHTVADLDCRVLLYAGYEDMQVKLRALLPPGARVAMEYVPFGALPTISRVDGGLLDLIRTWNVTVESSGPLISLLEVWDARQRGLHERAARGVDAARARALVWVAEQLRQGTPLREGDVAAHIAAYFAEQGLSGGDGPDVAVDANAADPHYATAGKAGATITGGAVLLIDLWARVSDAVDAPYADSTWMAFTGTTPPANVVQAFEAVRDARDAALEAVATAARTGASITGRSVDRAARAVLDARGMAGHILHRTGHSLGIDHVHGMGTNLDDVEFPDDRALVPNSGFTVEPGLYWPGRFGMRLEVSAILLPDGPQVTTELQENLTLLASEA